MNFVFIDINVTYTAYISAFIHDNILSNSLFCEYVSFLLQATV